MKTLILIPLIFSTVVGYAQRPGPDPSSGGASPLAFIKTIEGFPMVSSKYSQVVAGSPYLFDSVQTASLVLKNGHRYDSVPIKLNLLEDNIVFYKDGQEMIAKTPVMTIAIQETSTGQTYQLQHYSNFENIYAPVDKGWYQLLYNGKALLLKRIYKKLNESKPYNSPNIEQRIQTLSGYYVFTNKKMIPVKKLKELPAVFPDKEAAIKAALENKKIKGNEDIDWINAMNTIGQIL